MVDAKLHAVVDANPVNEAVTSEASPKQSRCMLDPCTLPHVSRKELQHHAPTPNHRKHMATTSSSLRLCRVVWCGVVSSLSWCVVVAMERCWIGTEQLEGGRWSGFQVTNVQLSFEGGVCLFRHRQAVLLFSVHLPQLHRKAARVCCSGVFHSWRKAQVSVKNTT